ncbi:hypothetical protein AB4Z21_14495 [Paenibacillus sp. MCAF20]
MKNSLMITILLTAAILSGCGNNEPANAPTATDPPAATTTPTDAPQETTAPEPTATEAPALELTTGEKLALEYVNEYINSEDAEAKKKFLEEKIHPDVQSIFQLGTSSVNTADKWQNASVAETVNYESAGKKGTLTLIKADEDKEVIVLIMDDKIGWSYESTDSSDKGKKAFEELRVDFK